MKAIVLVITLILAFSDTKAQSYFKFLTCTEQEILDSREVVITKRWVDDGDQMYTVLVNADKIRKGVLRINKYTNKVYIYSLNVTGAEIAVINNIINTATVRETGEFVWVETEYNDMADLVNIDDEVYVNFYDMDAKQ